MPKAITFSLDEQARMGAQYANGASLSDIASKFGVAKNTVRKVLLGNGVTFTEAAKRRRISVKAQGRPSARKGVVLSESTKAKMVATKQARNYPTSTYSRKFSAATKEKMRQSALQRWAENIRRREEKAAAKVVRSRDEIRQVERIRMLCKRLVRRVLKATGKRKEIPSEKYLRYSKKEFLQVVGGRPAGYELDHIVPVSEFLRRGITDPAIINALCNLRYIPKEENRKKSDVLPAEAEYLIAKAIEQGQEL